MMSIADRLLDEARRRGVCFWADGERIRFDGPPGAVDDRFLALVRAQRDTLLERLNEHAAPASGAHEKWLKPIRAGAKGQLFVIPAAGAGPSAFRAWRDVPAPGLGITLIHTPGREERLDEPPHRDVKDLADAIASVIAAEASRRPGKRVALFGHSVGALIAYEVAARLHGSDLVLLVIACSPPPDQASTEGVTATDAELLQAMAEWEGTPSELLADPGLAAAFLPSLRADLEVCASCRRRAAGAERLPMPILALAGNSDTATSPEHCAAWADWTASQFEMRVLEGGHFFPLTAGAEVVDLIHGHLEGLRVHAD